MTIYGSWDLTFTLDNWYGINWNTAYHGGV
jgi:hypothetical protein